MREILWYLESFFQICSLFWRIVKIKHSPDTVLVLLKKYFVFVWEKCFFKKIFSWSTKPSIILFYIWPFDLPTISAQFSIKVKRMKFLILFTGLHFLAVNAFNMLKIHNIHLINVHLLLSLSVVLLMSFYDIM